MTILTRGCQRCGRLTPLAQVGLVWLCAACVTQGLSAPCGDFHHDYRGGDAAWLCVTCGLALPVTPPPPVPAAPPGIATPDWYC